MVPLEGTSRNPGKLLKAKVTSPNMCTSGMINSGAFSGRVQLQGHGNEDEQRHEASS